MMPADDLLGAGVRRQAIVDGVDTVAAEMERKWGVGRLRLLVDDDMRDRFDRQCLKFNQVITDGTLADVEQHGAAMCRAWEALDQSAEKAGKPHLDPEVWEVQCGDNLIAITRTHAEASKLAQDGRYAEVWTLIEIAKLLEKFPEISEVKRMFPDSRVKHVRRT